MQDDFVPTNVSLLKNCLNAKTVVKGSTMMVKILNVGKQVVRLKKANFESVSSILVNNVEEVSE